MIRDWFQPPRRLLALFLAVTFVPAAGLVWLGWYLLQQDRALVEQRIQERRERASDLLVGALEAKVQAVERTLAQAAARADLDPDDDAVVVVLRQDGVNASPPHRLLFYPTASYCRQTVQPQVRAGEDQEFRFGNYGAAIASFSALTRSPDAAVRAGAQLRLARNLRKAGRFDAALAAYRQLAADDTASIDCIPADLVARRAQCALFSDLNRPDDLRREAGSLYTDLRGGRWRLDRAVYDVHAEDARNWLHVDARAEQESRALALGAAWLWERRAEVSGRHSMEAEGCFLTLVWTASAEGTAGLIAGPRYATRQWLAALQPILDAQGVRVSLGDSGGTATLGVRPSPPQQARRTASDTKLPWTLLVTSADPRADLAQLAGRRQLLLAGLALVAILVAAGSYFTARAFARELATARLQSDFVAAVSHEFRTPLASLRQLTENLRDGRVTTEDRRASYYEAQSRATAGLHRLVEGLLDFGRMEAGVLKLNLTPLDPARLVRDVAEQFRRDSAQQDHQIACTISDDPPMVRGDREALTLSLWNLLDNAAKYSPGAPKIWMDASRNGGDVAIRVRDAGPGIPAGEQREIFRKFYRGSAARAAGVKGTGIGLALAQHIVRAHGGEVRVASAPGAGSTFTIVLPGVRS